MATTPQARDVAQFIRDQHQEIKRLFDQIDRRQGDERREAFEDVVRLLAVHETAEEEVIYPMVRTETGGDEIADARIREESDAKRMLSDLEKVGTESDEFPPRFAVLRDSVTRHANSEEATVLPLLERTQDEAMLRRMTGAVQIAQSLAPTHPHPHAPGSAIGNMAVGPFAAIVDRTRDALRSLSR
jgi:hemerythrin superfamily protein